MSLLTTISVRLSAGTFTTSTWLGKTASSTESAEKAAKNLIEKINPLQHGSVMSKGRAINANGNLVEIFEIWGKLPRNVRR